MLNTLAHGDTAQNGIETLSPEEIESVAGGIQGYSRTDGSSFSWTGPNGIVYHDVAFVGAHVMEFADGGQEWFSDIFAVTSYPMGAIYNTLALSYSYVPTFRNP